MTRTIVVTGAAGFLGARVVARLHRAYPGRVVSVRRTPSAQAPPVPHAELVADLRDTGWHERLADADHVLWLAARRDHGLDREAAHRENVAPLAAAVRTLRRAGRLRRLVLASSVSALDQPAYPSRPLTDASVPAPVTPYGRSKLDSELLLAQSGLPVTVLRLPFLYGPGFRPGSFLDFYRRVAASPLLAALPYTATLSLLYTGDVADLVLQVLREDRRAEADQGPYLVSDGRVHSVGELVREVGRLHGREIDPLLPTAVGHAFSRAAWALTRPTDRARGRAGLLATYWAHAAFTPDHFVADSARFHAAFPECRYTEVADGLREAFTARTPATGPTPPPAVPGAGSAPSPAGRGG